PRHSGAVPRRAYRRAAGRTVHLRPYGRYQRFLRRIEHRAAGHRTGHRAAGAPLYRAESEEQRIMRGKFISSSEVDREQLDWGELGWISRPALTAAEQITVMEVTIMPGS